MKRTLLLALMSAAMLANATGTFSLIEINPLQGTEEYIWSDSSKRIYGGGELSNITIHNGKIYFTGQSTENNDELWTSDGTTAGTTLVKDINPNGSSMMGNILTVGNRMLFMATDNNNYDFDLFSSDGTADGTIKVADFNEGWNDALSGQRAALFGNKLLFCTSTSLISTDGTVAGTNTLLTIPTYNPAQGYCELNGKAYFSITNMQGKPELWMTDGTVPGTQLAMDLSTSGANIAYVSQILSFNGKIYIVGAISGEGYDLFSYTGGVNGQVNRIALTTVGNAYPESVTVYNNQLFLTASDAAGKHLYRMSTADATPVIVPTAPNIYIQSGLNFANNNIYFLTDNQFQINWVSLSDFSYHTLDLVNYTMPYYWFSTTGNFMVGNNGKLFFAAYDTSTQKQMFIESDGTVEGTIATMPAGANTNHPFNIIISCGSADVFDFKMWGDKVIVPANFNNAGRELWIYEPRKNTTGVTETESKVDVKLFPNPATRELNFQIAGAGYCETDVQVTGNNGQVVLRKKVMGELSSVDVSEFAAGNYCITFTNTTNRAATVKKFIVVK
ncbi:MAG TPA: T9SS type A sorting domain-containing protein [Chitinophagales bacterium]|nr:T9SS type A sorting domain-containing protein [Chitinophagales bacterium]